MLFADCLMSSDSGATIEPAGLELIRISSDGHLARPSIVSIRYSSIPLIHNVAYVSSQVRVFTAGQGTDSRKEQDLDVHCFNEVLPCCFCEDGETYSCALVVERPLRREYQIHVDIR